MKWKFRFNPQLSGALSIHNSGDSFKHNSHVELSLSGLCNPGLNKTAQSLCIAGNNLVTPVDPSDSADAFPDALVNGALHFQMHCSSTASPDVLV